MKEKIDISCINSPNPTIKYKRRIWIGVRNTPPELKDIYNYNTGRTLKQELVSEGIYPCLLIWETSRGEEKYAEVV